METSTQRKLFGLSLGAIAGLVLAFLLTSLRIIFTLWTGIGGLQQAFEIAVVGPLWMVVTVPLGSLLGYLWQTKDVLDSKRNIL